MGLFSRGKGKRDEESVARSDAAAGVDDIAHDDGSAADDHAVDELEDGRGAAAPVAGGDRTVARALDRSEVDDDSEYLNLGSIWLRGQNGMELRLEVNEQEQQVTGVTAVLGESAVQLQAFAAPRTEGVWIDIRNEIAESITGAGGTAEVVSGEFGEELLTRMPQSDASGRTVFMPARFVGIDGPRWFLRAVISGRAAIDPAAADDIHGVIKTVVVDRGEEAMPPRELLPLRLPEQPPATAPATTDEPQGGPHVDDLKPFERGPEITEVR